VRSPRPFELMHWAKRQLEPAPFPLGGSGTRSPGPEDDPPRLREATGFSSLGDEGGLPTLRAAIARAYGVGEDHVLVSDGASLANYTALLALAGAGDRVLVESPTYSILSEIPRFHGVRVIPLTRREETGWQPELDDVRHAADEAPLAAVVLTRLHNPTGADLSDSFLRGLAALAEQHDFHVLLDEVYLAFLPDAVPGFRLSPRFLSTGSVTKVQGFGGLRVGWILGEPDALRPIHEVSYYLAVNASAPSQILGAAVLAENERWLARARRLAAEGRATFEEWMSGRDDVSWVPPSGGLNAFVRLERVEDTAAFTRRLRAEQGVAIPPGVMFGAPGGVRISFSAAPPVLREGLRRTGQALDAWTG
jgi:aspartate/methionine/tyrosine aminotransferase